MRIARPVVLGLVAFGGLIGASALAQPPTGTDAQREAARLKTAVKVVTAETQVVGERLPPLQNGVERLLKKLKDVEPPKAVSTEKVEIKPTEPRQTGGPTAEPPKNKDVPEEWHLPLSRASAKKTNVVIVCNKGNVFLLDLKALNDAIDRDMARKLLSRSGTYILSTGDLDVTFDKEKRMVTAPKAGHSGETLQKALTDGSALRKRFKAFPASENILQFCVYPDSYDTFLEVRKLAYELKYDVGWQPLPVGKPIILGSGPATAQ